MSDIRICKTIDTHHSTQRAIGSPEKYWKNGETINISFLEGTSAQKDFVKQWATKWTDILNLNFNWVEKNGTIRISFADDGSWSYIGTEARNIDSSEPTMNFGWINEDIQDNDGSTVLHEFGHMLGLSHEHQNPDGGIQWNKPVVIKALSGPPNNWSLATIQANVFDKVEGYTQYTHFDPLSIMLYPFPAEWTLNGFQSKHNTEISETDKEFLSKVYPKNVTPITKQIDISKIFLKESDIICNKLNVVQRLAKELNIDIKDKTKSQLSTLIFKAL